VRSSGPIAGRRFRSRTHRCGQRWAAELGRYAAKGGETPYLHDMKVRDVIKMIEEDGWFLVRTKGSHRQFKHAGKLGLVTVPGKPSDELAPGTLNSILKQAGLKP